MTPKHLAIELLRSLNERDSSSAIGLFDPQAELFFPRHSPRAVYRGSRQLREFFDWLVANLPLQTLAADRVHENGNSATVEFETAGTSERGHAFDGVGALVIDTDGELIQAVRVYLDTADLGRILEVA